MKLNEFLYTCTQITACTPDISILLLHPQTHKLNFISGQYVDVLLSHGITLPMSIASSPQAAYLEFHLRHDQDHPIAQQLMAEVFEHKQLRLQGPKGNTLLSRADSEKLIFLAGGTGFAPIKALLQEALLAGQYKRLYLYWGVRRPEDAYEKKLLQQWQQTFPHFNYEIVLSQPEHFPDWQGPCGLVPHYLVQQHPDLQQVTLFASGPYEMIQAAYALFIAHGLAKERLVSDMI